MENMEKGERQHGTGTNLMEAEAGRIITEVHEDHAIMEADGMHLWIDDDTAEMFS